MPKLSNGAGAPNFHTIKSILNANSPHDEFLMTGFPYY